LHNKNPTLKQYKITSTKQMMSSPRPRHVKSQCKINMQRARQVLSYSKTELANSLASFCFANGTHLVCSILTVPYRSRLFVNTQDDPISHVGFFTHCSNTHNFIQNMCRCNTGFISWYQTECTTWRIIALPLAPHLVHQFAQHRCNTQTHLSASLGTILGASVSSTLGTSI
jgi:hypothetical protein